MIFPSVSQLCLEFPHPPEIDSQFFPFRRWRLLDPHALPLPVKPGKSRQIVARQTADPPASDQCCEVGASMSVSARSDRDRYGAANQCVDLDAMESGRSRRSMGPAAANPVSGMCELTGTRWILRGHQSGTL